MATFELSPLDFEKIAEAVVCRLGDGQKRTQWLTVKEAAEHLRCSPRQVERLVYLGQLKAYRPAGKRLFKVEDLDALVHQTEEA